MTYYLALGSNMGNRGRNLESGIRLLEAQGRVGSVSSVYRSPAQGMPADLADFFNLVLRLDSELEPRQLLMWIKIMEASMGRDLSPGPPRSRRLDVDILLCDNRVLNTPELTIPHPRMPDRAFVLFPLAEIAADVVHPVLKTSIRTLRQRLDNREGMTRVGDPPIVSGA
ncbi:MAG: 2-amino-4-hydroxy-6-hydroxymethyldihydropteridine diphosphokinase [Acidobacteriota bacterium]|jgi:2-amino-4-hydroxy-6-hydroxymethyldihydropteridine diphosphokinase|nr:2-amino-4-hydroxy-6-hydroxymethyldihydropteridine diphosphokinase [Acidobacteriota bacterium]